jgi:hypothetical protein
MSAIGGKADQNGRVAILLDVVAEARPSEKSFSDAPLTADTSAPAFFNQRHHQLAMR